MSSSILHLLEAALPREGAELTDGQLLDRFVDGRDEAALAALVCRHGPMVWGVCRRILSGQQDAEDAFQASFLVLVRRAASIQPRERVANWLYGVAYQTARKARALAARRKAREGQVREMPEPAAPGPGPWSDVRPLLDQELSRLPDKYRAVVVLSDLEEKSRAEAALQLGLPEGTVASRLARGRAMLAKRLRRRGVALSGALLAPVCVPPALLISTLEGAAGRAVPAVSALADGVLKAMWLGKIRTGLVLVLAVSLLALLGAVSALARPRATGQQDADPVAGQPNQAGLVSEGPVPSRARADVAPPRPLPDEVVAAWRTRGAQVGWVAWDNRTGTLAFRPGGEAREGDLPAFRFLDWPNAPTLAELPVPPRGFGVCHMSSHMTDADLRGLARLQSLQALGLVNCPDVTAAGMKGLAQLKSLRALDLRWMAVTDAGLRELAGLESLERLCLDRCRKVSELKALAGLKALRSLHLVDTSVSDLRPLAGLKSLETLDLAGTRVVDLEGLAGLKALRSLRLAGTRVSDLRALAGLTSLEVLDLAGTKATELKALAGLKALRSARLGHTSVTDADLEGLAGLGGLLSLGLDNTNVTDRGLKHLAGLTSLTALDLHDTKVTDAGLKELAPLASLRSLDLTGTLVTARGLKGLAGHRSLETVDVYRTKVTTRDAADLKKALPRLTVNTSR